ncbi:hypothetical protein CKAH01_01854 [Colletotrichum kahawae]|uniref:Uncharacterized protein n=1 Tax=Colletotrichum kahawae TaxID=34407 RepID=A0AAD9Y4I9_COLKA|nr:hypothetical protein CKAH01_01854 [Colletotrichum kahawae]
MSRVEAAPATNDSPGICWVASVVGDAWSVASCTYLFPGNRPHAINLPTSQARQILNTEVSSTGEALTALTATVRGYLIHWQTSSSTPPWRASTPFLFGTLPSGAPAQHPFFLRAPTDRKLSAAVLPSRLDWTSSHAAAMRLGLLRIFEPGNRVSSPSAPTPGIKTAISSRCRSRPLSKPQPPSFSRSTLVARPDDGSFETSPIDFDIAQPVRVCLTLAIPLRTKSLVPWIRKLQQQEPQLTYRRFSSTSAAAACNLEPFVNADVSSGNVHHFSAD